MRLMCERCGRRIRQVVSTPLGAIIQDFTPSGRVAEIDEDVCTACEAHIIRACDAYNEGRDDE